MNLESSLSLAGGGMSSRRPFKKIAAAMLAVASACIPALAQSSGAYKVTNIISDGSVPAPVTDANFINPWAISSSGTWWIATANTGFDYAVASAGTISFKVIVPNQSGLTTATGTPAGSVTTGGAVGMILPSNQTKCSFIFSTLDGTISCWNSKLGTANALSQIVINNNAAGASYPGLAVLNVPASGSTTIAASYLLAPNFGTANKIEVYDSNFQPAKLTGSFTDPNLPAGYSPFGIHIIGTQIYVTYAVRSSAKPYVTVNGAGNGIVDIFDVNGNFVSRAATGGNLNAPWGVAIAPANFGIYSNDLIIGNFGDGMINVYDPKTFTFLGQVTDGTGKPLVYQSLWELLPGGTTVTGTTGVSGGDTSTVYFSAGLANEAHGLFAGIAKDPGTGTPSFGFSVSGPSVTTSAGGFATLPIAISPTFNFSGAVNLSCSGIPANATCIFSNPQLTVSPTASATSTVTLGTIKGASAKPFDLLGKRGGIVAAALLPFASLLLLRRRKLPVRLMGLAVAMVLMSGALAGCGAGAATTAPVSSTPSGTSNVVLTATSGGVTKTVTVKLTVQ